MDNANGAYNPSSTYGILSSNDVNWDFMDDLLYQGCWLETDTEGFNFSQHSPSTSNGALYSSSDYAGENFFLNSHHQNIQENQSLHHPKIVENELKSDKDAVKPFSSLVQSEKFSTEEAEIGREWWIGPNFYSVKERLKKAMEYLKCCTKNKDVLIQIWMPVTNGGKIVLTTIDQPYIVTPNCKNLAGYRKISKAYVFPVDAEDHKDLTGFPARVFLEKLPEWTPDVRLFRNENEYPRKDQTSKYKICGSLAVPVIEKDSETCLAIVEIVTSTPMIDHHPELEEVCKALEAVDLKSSQDFCTPGVKCYDQLYRVAVPEISTILKFICKTYNLPLALTWSPCHFEGKMGCMNLSEKFASCMSTVRSACYLADRDFSHFFAASTEQFLFVGQGIVGRAFSNCRQCFASDVTAFSKTTYPLSHHAKMFGLRAAIAIPLLNISDSSVKFVLELFLPKDCQDIEEQKYTCDLLAIVIQQTCRSLFVVMDKETGEESEWKFLVASDSKISKHEKGKHFDNMSWTAGAMEAQNKGKSSSISMDYPKEEPKEEFKVTTYWNESPLELNHNYQFFSDLRQLQKNCEVESSVGTSYSLSRYRSSEERKPGRKRRSRIDKTISLQDLRQYYAGSLKDAAKNIGVCPTTLKRICRKHGITRWPSRKIKKVGHSLKKLQKVIDSVQGAEGAIEIGSFYSAFPGLSSPKAADSGHPSEREIAEHSEQLSPPQSESSSKSHSLTCTMSCSDSTCCSNKQTAATCGLIGKNAVVLNNPSGPNYKTLTLENPSNRTQPSLKETCGGSLKDGGAFRVKASFGSEKVRLTLQPSWGIRNLKQEITGRFGLSDITGIDFQYMDEDGEWVSLTSDADLEECKEIFRYSHCSTIQIFLHDVSQAIPENHTGLF